VLTMGEDEGLPDYLVGRVCYMGIET
jgi:hypothetical protein